MKASLLTIHANLGEYSKIGTASLVIAVYLISFTLAAYLSGPRDEPSGSDMAPRDQASTPAPAASDIPAILSAADAGLYRRVFALQQRGEFAAAAALAPRIDDTLLMGHVLAHRFQHTPRPKTGDLRHWLVEYDDHPDAGWIYRLVQKRLPRKSRKSIKPLPRRHGLAVVPDPAPPYASKKNLTRKQRRRVTRIKRAIRIWLRRGHIRKTERLLRRGYVGRLLDRYEMDAARARIAAAWFYKGQPRKASRLAARAIAGSGKALPMTRWIAGLAAWRMGRAEQAARHFETLASAPGRSGWVRAGAALWAARAHGRLGRETEAANWREQAARYPYTLYGVLAHEELKRDLPLAPPQRGAFTIDMAELLASNLGGRRALALGEIGELQRAEQELLGIEEWDRPDMRAALRAAADHFGIPSIRLKMARRDRVRNPDDSRDQPLDASLYPVVPWKPERESGIDRALLLALMRQESDFNASARSPAGALGLMQVMPNTARFLNRGRRFRGAHRRDWANPLINADLGQRYLTYLRTHRRIRDDLVKMIAAYNSGPGNIAYWARRNIGRTDDPLLFVESIPNLETRLFVRRVLANLWIYRHRLGQSAPSLEAMAAGRFPRYSPVDGAAAPADFANVRPPANE